MKGLCIKLGGPPGTQSTGTKRQGQELKDSRARPEAGGEGLGYGQQRLWVTAEAPGAGIWRKRTLGLDVGAHKLLIK